MWWSLREDGDVIGCGERMVRPRPHVTGMGDGDVSCSVSLFILRVYIREGCGIRY